MTTSQIDHRVLVIISVIRIFLLISLQYGDGMGWDTSKLPNRTPASFLIAKSIITPQGCELLRGL